MNIGEQAAPPYATAVALDAGKEGARGRSPAQHRAHRFSVRVVGPRWQVYSPASSDQAQVVVPEGKKLDRVELYLKDPAATLSATYVQLCSSPRKKLTLCPRRAPGGGNTCEDNVRATSPGFTDDGAVRGALTSAGMAAASIEGMAKEDFKV